MPIQLIPVRSEHGPTINWTQGQKPIGAIAVNMRPIILIPCSDRKRETPSHDLRAHTLPQRKPEFVSKVWIDRVAAASNRKRAKNMYCGRSFKEGLLAANRLNAELSILSAGLGLVFAEDLIPPYSLTVSPSAKDSIKRVVEVDNWHPREWWNALTKHTKQRTDLCLFLGKPNRLALIALSENYAKMIGDSLADLPQDHIDQIRIFGLGLERHLPRALHRCVMPYDRRLDDPLGPGPGTLTDFAARALHHFAKLHASGDVEGRSKSADAGAVSNSLQNFRAPKIPVRSRLTDEDIKDFILKNWDIVGGRSQAMLRHLRDSGLACEQSRFVCLFRAVARERQEAQL